MAERTATRPCRTCGKPVPPDRASKASPFCSERCQLVDLGKWLGEEYRIAGRPEEQEDEERLPTEDDDDA